MPQEQNLDKDKEPPSGGSLFKAVKLFSNLLAKFSRKKHLSAERLINNNLSSKKYEIAKEKIVNNYEQFSLKTAQDVMIPRSEIIDVTVDVKLEDLNKTINLHSNTRTLVFEDNLDKIIGFIHIKDLFEILTHSNLSNVKPNNSENFTTKKILRKHIVCPYSMKLIDLLTQMQVHRTHIAVVVDEYGCTDGIITIEDVIEEIIGEIDDEHDEIEVNNFNLIKPGTIITNARVEIQEIEEMLGVKLDFKDSEFDTIGGLVMAKAGRVPSNGQIIELSESLTAEILDASPRTVNKVKLVLSK
jgi:CBS domain containing-hemolysin-like protein